MRMAERLLRVEEVAALLSVSRWFVYPASKPDGAERRGLEGPVKTGEEGSVTIGRELLETLLDHKEASAYDGDDDLVFPDIDGAARQPLEHQDTGAAASNHSGQRSADAREAAADPGWPHAAVAQRLDDAIWGQNSGRNSGRKNGQAASGEGRFRSTKRKLEARPAGFEPATSASGGQRSIH
jgi:predicted DNA-binding transcriptional regulator AlpA